MRRRSASDSRRPSLATRSQSVFCQSFCSPCSFLMCELCFFVTLLRPVDEMGTSIHCERYPVLNRVAIVSHLHCSLTGDESVCCVSIMHWVFHNWLAHPLRVLLCILLDFSSASIVTATCRASTPTLVSQVVFRIFVRHREAERQGLPAAGDRRPRPSSTTFRHATADFGACPDPPERDGLHRGSPKVGAAGQAFHQVGDDHDI